MTEALESRWLLSAGTPSQAELDLMTPAELSGIGVARVSAGAQSAYARAGEWVMKLDAPAGTASDLAWARQAVAAQAASTVDSVEALGGDDLYRVVTDPAASISQVRSSLQGVAGFQYVQPNYLYWADAIPNDPSFSQLWGLHNTGQTGGTVDADIDAPEGWDVFTGDGSVVVAIIDTGIDYTHPDLAANMWRNPGEVAGNGIDDDGNGFIDDVYGYDFVGSNDSNPMDDHYHGTHVAGTIGGVGNNAVGVAGVAWNVKLMAVKFLDSTGSGNTADAIESVNYVTMMRNRGVNVRLTSNSWGGGAFDQALLDAINASGNAGLLFVAAAGNDGMNTDTTPSYPASYNAANIISVANLTATDGLSSTSNYGLTSVDLGAPGTNIYSTSPGNTYRTLSGTSMATPHVSGVAALAFMLDPSATPAEIKSLILSNVDPIPALAGKSVTGGRLNLFKVLEDLGVQPTEISPAPGNVVSSPLTAFSIGYAEPYDPSSVQASDLLVNGIPADGVTFTSSVTLIFTFNASPLTTQGVQTITMAKDAIKRQRDGMGTMALSSTFYYDSSPMSVVSVTPAPYSIAPLPFTRVRFDFSEPYAAGSVSASDLVVNRGTVSSVNPVDADTLEFVISGVTTEGLFTFNIPNGAITDSAGNPFEGYSASVTLDVGTLPLPTPMSAVAPAGSLIHSSQTTAQIGVAGDQDCFTISLDAGQTLTAWVDPAASLKAMLEVLDPSGTIVATASSSSAGLDAVVQSIDVATAGLYTFRISGLGSTTGDYALRVIVNAAAETEAHDGPANDSRATAQNLAPALKPLPLGGSRASVVGTIGAATDSVLGTEDFESGALGAAWSTWSSDLAGRIRVTNAFPAADGSYSLAMDRSIDGDYTLNEAVWTVDLSSAGAAAIKLGFSQAEWGDEEQGLPATFNNHYDGDGVAFSVDGVTWYRLWNAVDQATPGQWQAYTVDLSAAARAAGVTLGSSVKIKFQQYDNFAMYSDGRAFDGISITADVAANDWYRVTLGSAGSISVVAAGSTLNTLALYDSSGNFICNGRVADANRVIDDYVATAGDYYIRLFGTAGDYTLTALVDTAFDVPASAGAPIALGTRQSALGTVANTGSGRLFAYDYSGNLIKELNPATGAVINSFASPVTTSSGPDYGMATTGNSLLVGGNPSSPIYELSFTGTTIRTIPNTIGISGMAFLNNEIFVLTDATSTQNITVLDYATGAVKRTLTTSTSIQECLSASANALYGAYSTTVYAIDINTGACTSKGTLSFSYPEGMGIIGNEMFLGTGSTLQVRDLATLALKRTLTGLTDLEGLAADGGGAVPDVYTFRVKAGDTLVIRTATPGDGPNQFENTLDPKIELLGPAGTVLASDDNSEDGRNAKLTYTATVAGTYTVRIMSAGGEGAYVLRVEGASGGTEPFAVASTTPANGASIVGGLTSFTVDLNDAVLPSSIAAGDLLIDGAPASAFTLVDTDTITFTIGAALGDGAHTVTLAAGALADLQGTPLDAYTGTFTLDVTGPQVINSSIQEGSVYDPSLITFSFSFSKPLLATGLDNTDFTLVGAKAGSKTPTSFTYVSATNTLNVVYATLPEDAYTFTLISGDGRVEGASGNDLDGETPAWPIPPNHSGDGTPGGNFVVHFSTDRTTGNLPAFDAVAPVSSLIHEAMVDALISPGGDVDSFRVDLEAGQNLTLIVDPAAALKPVITLRSPGGAVVQTVTAAAAGKDVVLLSPIAVAGIYTIDVSADGATDGNFTLQALLNADAEREIHDGPANDSRATAQDLSGSFIRVSGKSRGAVVGRAEPSGMLPSEIEPNNTTATANNAVTNFTPYTSGNLFHLQFNATIGTSSDYDYFNIGTLDVGDVITIATSALGSSRGTSSDPHLYLYRGPSSSPVSVTSGSHNGPGNDGLIYRYTITTADTYYIQASYNTGTYSVEAYLENTGAAPATGGNMLSETEPNDTAATANDASTSWRPVQYFSRTAGSITSGDIDVYQYQFDAGDLLSINIDSLTTALDARVSLLDSNGTTIALDDGTSSGPSYDSPIYAFRIPSAGTYYVQVQAYSGTGTYNADLYLSATTAPPVPTAGDYYSFTLASGDRVSLGLELQSAGSAQITLQDASGADLATGAAGATNWTRVVNGFVAPAAGTYYVRVNQGTNNDYSLVVAINQALETESNNTRATAQGLGASTSVLGSLESGIGGPITVGLIEDNLPWGYNVNTPMLTSLGYTVTKIASSSLATADLSPYRMLILGGQQYASTYSTVQSNMTKIESFVAAGGIWLVDYAAYSSDNAYTYDVLPGTPSLSFTGTSGSNIDILAPGSLLVNGPGGVITNTSLDGVSSSYHGYATGTLPTGGTAILSTGTASQLTAFDYPYQGGHVVIQTSPVEYFSYQGNAGFQAFHKNLFNFGASFVQVADEDYYAVDLTAGKSYVFRTRTPGDAAGAFANTLDPRLELQDSSGTVLVSDDNSDADKRNARLIFTPTATGTYYLRASAVSGEGAYVIETDSPPQVQSVQVSSTSWSASFLAELKNKGLGDGSGYAVPTGPAQLDILPWTNINVIKVTFTEQVTAGLNDLSVTGLNPASVLASSCTSGPGAVLGTWEVRWVLASALPADRITLTVPDTVLDTTGNALDGEWADGAGAFPSGNGAAGGAFAFRINVLPGDTNRSGAVNTLDTVQTRNLQFTAVGTPNYSIYYDVDGSGAINIADTTKVRNQQFTQLPPPPAPSAPASDTSAPPTVIGKVLPGIVKEPAELPVAAPPPTTGTSVAPVVLPAAPVVPAGVAPVAAPPRTWAQPVSRPAGTAAPVKTSRPVSPPAAAKAAAAPRKTASPARRRTVARTSAQAPAKSKVAPTARSNPFSSMRICVPGLMEVLLEKYRHDLLHSPLNAR